MNKKPWIAALLNFFFMGPGYIYNGRRVALGIGWTLAALALTYVEQSIKPLSSNLYWTMFAAVFVANTCFAIDGWRESHAINAGGR